MPITRSATSRILAEIVDKLEAHSIFKYFHLFTSSDFEEEKYPEMPFIGIKAMERDTDDYFTRSIRAMEVDVVIVIHAKSDHHPNDPTLYGWEYATWLAETMVNFLNTIDFGDTPWVIERDCMKDVDDGELDNDLVYTVMTTMHMLFETVAL